MTFPATKEDQNTLPTLINIGDSETFCPLCKRDVYFITVTEEGQLPVKICSANKNHRFGIKNLIINPKPKP